MIAEAAALVRLQHERRKFPLYFYRPSTKMRAFHESTCIIRQMVGANRSGKTETSHAEIGAYALGYRPWVLRELGLPMPTNGDRPANLPDAAICKNGAGIRVKVPNTGIVVTGLSLKKGAGEVSLPKLQALLGPLIKQVRLGHAGTPAEVVLVNGSSIRFGSAEQDVMAVEGTAYDWIAVDEPIPRRMYVGLRRGSIDNFAPIWFSYTPLGNHAQWMFKELYSKADGKRIFSMTASIYDNEYLTPEAIAEFAADPAISDIEKEARLYGRFQNLFDRIYADFDSDVHVVPYFEPPSHWFRTQVVDPHSVRPWACAWYATSPSGDTYVYREWPETDFTKIRRVGDSPERYALRFREIERDEQISARLMDPNYFGRTDMLRGVVVPSVGTEIAKFGLIYNGRLNDDLDYGEGRVRQLLQYRKEEPISFTNRPRLYVCDNCVNTIASLSFYTYETAKSGDPDEKKRSETYKDFADLVRYFAVSDVAALALSEAPAPYDPTYYTQRADSGSGYGEPE